MDPVILSTFFFSVFYYWEILYGTLIDLAFPVGTPTFLTATSDTIMVIKHSQLCTSVRQNVSQSVSGHL